MYAHCHQVFKWKFHHYCLPLHRESFPTLVCHWPAQLCDKIAAAPSHVCMQRDSFTVMLTNSHSKRYPSPQSVHTQQLQGIKSTLILITIWVHILPTHQVNSQRFYIFWQGIWSRFLPGCWYQYHPHLSLRSPLSHSLCPASKWEPVTFNTHR